MITRSRSLFSLLPAVILILLPLLASLFGARLVLQRQEENRHRLRQTEAESLLETLAESWSFQAQLGMAGVRFRQELNRIMMAPLPKDARRRLLSAAARRVFGAPFPAHQLWVLGLDSDTREGPGELLVEPEAGTTARRPMLLALRHFLKQAGGDPENSRESKVAEKIVAGLFGEHTHSSLVSVGQAGKANPVFFQKQQQFLLWDFMTDARGRPVAGFFLVTPNTAAADRAGFRLALANSESRRPRGFLRYHPSPQKTILAGPWSRHPEIRAWAREFRRRHPLVKLERQPAGLLSTEFSTGTLFVKLIPGSTHLAIVLFPPLPVSPARDWPGLLCLVLGGGVLMVVLRGALLGHWPKVGLQLRFLLLFGLAAAFPFLAVAIIAGLSLQEKQESLLLGLQRDLQAELISIDLGKDGLQTKMLSAFRRAARNPELRELLHREDAANPRVLDICQGPFRELGTDFPLPYIGIYDYFGNTYARDGRFVTARTNELVSFFRSSMICSLWRALKGKMPTGDIPPNPLKHEEQMLLDVFEGAAASKIENMVGEYRNMVAYLTMGQENISQIHECYQVGGVNRYALMVMWRNADFAALVLRETLERFLLAFPHGSFMAFHRERGGIRALLPESKSHRPLHEAVLENGRIVRQRTIFDREAQTLTMVMTSRRNPDEILAALIDTSGIQRELNAVTAALVQSFLVWVLGTAGLLLVTVRRIVWPIRRMTTALTEVARGNLEQQLKLDRPDELGQLGNAFETMIDGLKRRRRLATVVSQKAREDLFAESGGRDQVGGATITRQSEGSARRAYRTEAVALVSDIRNFTTICESRPTREITLLLNRHFEVMAEVITRHQGRIDKFIGDAIQATFEQLPGEEEPDGAARRALEGAREMLEQLSAINREREAAGGFGYAMGVGLAWGEVVFGGFGDRALRFDYSAMGEPMRLAAYLEGVSKKVPAYPLVVCTGIRRRVGAMYPMLTALPGHEEEAAVFPEALRAGIPEQRGRP
jgi:class 3 adenylate cyclase